MIELKFVNRKVRLTAWVIQFVILIPLMCFFIICFYTKGSYEYKNTLLENLFDVEEYCISEGWVKVPSAKALDRRGQPLMMKIKGTVEAFYK